MQERWLVYASFLIIFAFTTVDASISPMVLPLQAHFGVPMEQVLRLISSCTAGIVLGVFWGPMLTRAFKLPLLIVWTVTLMVLGTVGFLLSDSFELAMLCRLVFGGAAGVMASVMWWITFHGVSKANYQAMVNVLMSARPLAAALGVPLATIVASRTNWNTPFALFTLLILACGLLLYAMSRPLHQHVEKWETKGMLRDYRSALSQPMAIPFYTGVVFNKACYFGLYAIAGIWFYRHYGLHLVEVGTRLFFIGLSEVVMTFAAPHILKQLGYVRTFVGSLLLSGVVFLLLIKGYFPLNMTTTLFVIFVGLDRVSSMAITLALPKLFPLTDNRAVFGSLITLAAWFGLTLVSYFEGSNIDRLGLGNVEWILLASFIMGSYMIYHVQRTRVFHLMEV
jgi:predicted MFS family arabinose efflux permease